MKKPNSPRPALSQSLRIRTVNNGKVNKDSPATLILACYIIVLLPSTFILMTPLASISGLHWIDALFTATSALTVTGLGVVDTGEHFGVVGQVWLMLLMQLGGLGQMTLSFVVLLSLGKQVSLSEKALLREELNQDFHIDIVRLVKSIVIFALIIQTIGAFILAIVWVPERGLLSGFYYATFHAISAFNNAGFSLFSDSLMQYASNPIVCICIALLLIIGGLGFTVIVDITEWLKHRKKRRLNLHSKLVLSCSAILLVFGTLMIFILEYNSDATLAPLSLGDKILAAFFQSATARTAGFNSLNLANMHQATLLIMMLLMFIGAGSTSTGGGIKVSTFAVALIATRSFLQNKNYFSVFRRNIAPLVALKALAIIVVSFAILIGCTFLLTITEQASFNSILFEAISAFSTVGLTTGLTAQLSDPGKLIMIFLMIIGRIGPITLAYVFIHRKVSRVRYAYEDVIVG